MDIESFIGEVGVLSAFWEFIAMILWKKYRFLSLLYPESERLHRLIERSIYSSGSWSVKMGFLAGTLILDESSMSVMCNKMVFRFHMWELYIGEMETATLIGNSTRDTDKKNHRRLCNISQIRFAFMIRKRFQMLSLSKSAQRYVTIKWIVPYSTLIHEIIRQHTSDCHDKPIRNGFFRYE